MVIMDKFITLRIDEEIHQRYKVICAENKITGVPITIKAVKQNKKPVNNSVIG